MPSLRRAGESAVLAIAAFATFTVHAAALEVPGCAWAVHDGGKTILEGGFGVRNVHAPVPITADTVFDIASVSKQFTALSILQLAERGVLDLGDSVRRYLPQLPVYFDSIRLRHLLWHTGGVPDYIDPLFDAGRRTATVGVEEVMELLALSKEVEFEPGTRFEYSNSGYVLLGQVIERTSGKSMADYVQDHIFRPLGMRSTRLVDHYPNPVQGRASGHRRTPDGLPNPVEITWTITGDGQVFSTVGDLRRWMRALAHGHPAITPEVLATFKQRGRLDNGQPVDYGFGLEFATLSGQELMLHEGAWSGSVSRFVWSPQGFGGSMLCNYHDVDVQGLLDPMLFEYAGVAVEPEDDVKRQGRPFAVGAGHRVRGTVPAGESYVFYLDISPGDVVQGEFQGAETVLDLESRQGNHLRRLGDSRAASQSFMWITSGKSRQLVVRNPGNVPGEFDLTLILAATD